MVKLTWTVTAPNMLKPYTVTRWRPSGSADNTPVDPVNVIELYGAAITVPSKVSVKFGSVPLSIKYSIVNGVA